MGHRAEKNRLRHGFASGERPPTPPIHTAGKGAKVRRWYAALKSMTGWQSPKIGRRNKDGKQEWAPRHKVQEKKTYGKD